MKTFSTKYGILKGISYLEVYDNGNIKECILEEENKLSTPYGLLVPQYEEDNVRRKYISSLSFYQNGDIKSISLNHQTDIKTELGVFAAEKIIFYEGERLKKIFPLNGKISGYWTEENEYELAKEYTLSLSIGKVKGKFISLKFYPSQKLKNVTLWPKERLTLLFGSEPIKIRTGFSLYETGELKSYEPAEPVPVQTLIGTVTAYDVAAPDIYSEIHSLQFTKEGQISTLATSTDQIKIHDKNSSSDFHTVIYAPHETPNLLNPDVMNTVPVHIGFNNDQVVINDEIYYALNEHTFAITHHFKDMPLSCVDCSSCHLYQ